MPATAGTRPCHGPPAMNRACLATPEPPRHSIGRFPPPRSPSEAEGEAPGHCAAHRKVGAVSFDPLLYTPPALPRAAAIEACRTSAFMAMVSSLNITLRSQSKPSCNSVSSLVSIDLTMSSSIS